MFSTVRAGRILLLGALVAAASSTGGAQVRTAAADAVILREAKLVTSSGRIDLYADGVDVDTVLARRADAALAALERISGRTYDTATLGDRLALVVSSRVTVSHVWSGYEHPSDPKGVLFLGPRVVRAALSGRNATHLHELTHLLTWRFSSHTLREGIADYLALQLMPGVGVGPNPDGYAEAVDVPASILRLLGTSQPPPSEVSADAAYRSAYYFASYRFVRFLIERRDLPTFWRLYDARLPEQEYERLYGATREALVQEAFSTP